jgi:hypothetical protein
MVRIVDQALPVRDEAHVQPADAPDADDRLAALVGPQLPEKARVDQARDHFLGRVHVSVVGRKDPGQLLRRMVRRRGIRAMAVVGRAGCRELLDLRADARDRRRIVRHAHVGATGLVHVHLRAADVERGEVLALRPLDERRARDDHVRALGHVHAVGDDRHVAATRDAVAEHGRDLRHAGGGEIAVALEDVAGAGAAGEGLRLLGEVETGAVDEVDSGEAQAEGHLLGALDLLGGAWPPGAGGDGVVVGEFFGGNPALILVRLVILSVIVGVVLAALGFSPFEIIDSIRRLVERIYDMGFAAVEKAFRYFLLGAVIVFPVWLVMRVLKMVGRAGSDGLVDQGSRNREA